MSFQNLLYLQIHLSIFTIGESILHCNKNSLAQLNQPRWNEKVYQKSFHHRTQKNRVVTRYYNLCPIRVQYNDAICASKLRWTTVRA